MSQKLAVVVPQPRQGRKMVAQGASPGGTSPSPRRAERDTPLPRERERGRGRGRVLLLTADALGYPLSPRQVGADFINELLTQDTRDSSALALEEFAQDFKDTFLSAPSEISRLYPTD